MFNISTFFKHYDVTTAFRLGGAGGAEGEQAEGDAGDDRLRVQRGQEGEEEQLAGGVRAGLPGEEARQREGRVPEGEEGIRGATARQTPQTRFEVVFLTNFLLLSIN